MIEGRTLLILLAALAYQAQGCAGQSASVVDPSTAVTNHAEGRTFVRAVIQQQRLVDAFASPGVWQSEFGTIELDDAGFLRVDMGWCLRFEGEFDAEEDHRYPGNCIEVGLEGELSIREHRAVMQLEDPRMPWPYGAYIDAEDRLHFGHSNGLIVGVHRIDDQGYGDFAFSTAHLLHYREDGCTHDDRLFNQVEGAPVECARVERGGLTYLELVPPERQNVWSDEVLILFELGVMVDPLVDDMVFERVY